MYIFFHLASKTIREAENKKINKNNAIRINRYTRALDRLE